MVLAMPKRESITEMPRRHNDIVFEIGNKFPNISMAEIGWRISGLSKIGGNRIGESNLHFFPNNGV